MKAVPVNPSEVFKTIQEYLVALRSVDYSQLSKVEKEEMRRELMEVRGLALSIKREWMSEELAKLDLHAAARGCNPSLSTSTACDEQCLFSIERRWTGGLHRRQVDIDKSA